MSSLSNQSDVSNVSNELDPDEQEQPVRCYTCADNAIVQVLIDDHLVQDVCADCLINELVYQSKMFKIEFYHD